MNVFQFRDERGQQIVRFGLPVKRPHEDSAKAESPAPEVITAHSSRTFLTKNARVWQHVSHRERLLSLWLRANLIHLCPLYCRKYRRWANDVIILL